MKNSILVNIKVDFESIKVLYQFFLKRNISFEELFCVSPSCGFS